jgi:hypothetical protein
VGVIIGMDPHTRSATVEVIDEAGRAVAVGRFGTDKTGYQQMLAAGREHPDRVWAVEGCNGIGKHMAHRLVHDGERWWSCRRSCPRRCGCSPPATVARPTLSTPAKLRWLRCTHQPDRGLRRVEVDDDLVVMGLLVDRRDELGRARTRTINRLHRLLLELFPGGAKRFLSAPQARALIATTRPRDLVGKTRRRLAVELVTELEANRQEDQGRREGAHRAGHRTRLHADGPDRRRAHRGGPAAGRCRRDPPLRRQGPVRVLERHRAPGRLLRCPTAPPPLPGREPADQPNPAHHGRRAAAQPHARSKVW